MSRRHSRHRSENIIRAETGPMRFGNDWRGLFIRGDDAFRLAIALEQLLAKSDDQITQISQMQMRGLVALLYSADERNGSREVQAMRPIEECRADVHGRGREGGTRQ